MCWWADELLSKISDGLECMGEWICLRLLWLLHNDNEDNKNTIISNIFWHLLSPPGHLTHNQKSLNFSNIAISLFSSGPRSQIFLSFYQVLQTYCRQRNSAKIVILESCPFNSRFYLFPSQVEENCVWRSWSDMESSGNPCEQFLEVIPSISCIFAQP